jgi:uncharacterized protein YndB with AHSA1/START domain
MTDRVFRVTIDAPPERVWAALVEPERVRAWYYDTAPRTTWETGAAIDFVDDDGNVAMTGVVLTYDPPRSFSHTFIATWGEEPDDQGTLTWTLEPLEGGCAVTLLHVGGHGEETNEGSAYLVTALKAYVEGSA